MYCKKCLRYLPPNTASCPGCGTVYSTRPPAGPPVQPPPQRPMHPHPQMRPTQHYSSPPPPPQRPIHPPPQPSQPPPQQGWHTPPYRAVPSARRRGINPIYIALSAVGIVAILLFGAWLILLQDQDTPETINDDIPIVAETPGDIPAVTQPIIDTEPQETTTLSGPDIFAKNRDAVIIIRLVDSWGNHIGTGSGFFVCPTGIAVTNHHVMVDATRAIAILYDRREFDITGFFSYDIENDLAVIQVDGQGEVFHYAVFGNSNEVRVGDDVFAIGGPDWDPITFTSGMLSRIAYEPINFDIYSIEGMLQSTAAIYGGNSGGPLLNDRGQVIGVNAAAHMIRASVQFAVPIYRVELPTPGDSANPLPVGRVGAPSRPSPGHDDTYTRFPFIPTFMSASRHGRFSFSGTPDSLGLSRGDVLYDYYYYLYIYDLQARHWIADTDAFDVLLLDSGFIFQSIRFHDGDTWVYFFHPSQDMSLSYAFMPDGDVLLIAIAQGDVYTRFYYGEPDENDAPPPQNVPPGTGTDMANHPLIGSWLWLGSLYYVFNDDGSGIMYNMAITWTANNGILAICVTPDACYGRPCPAPAEWFYTIDGNTLTLVSRTSNVSFTYTRQ